MKKAGICILSLLFLVSFTSAINIQETEIDGVIIPELNHPAKFLLQISGVPEGSYNIYTLTDVTILPTGAFSLTSGTNNIEIFIYPTKQLDIRGLYSFNYNIGNSSSRLTVKIANLEDILEINSGSNSPDLGNMTFYIKNKENTKLTDLKATFSSIFFEFSDTFNLGPNEEKNISIKVDKDKLKTIGAGSYPLKAEFETINGGKIIEGNIYLGEKKGVETRRDSSGFLINTKTITKINIGNIEEPINININKDIITRLFTSFNIKPDTIKREGLKIIYSWTRTLSPAEIFVIKAKTNYIFPLIIILLAAALIKGFRTLIIKKVEVTKSVSPLKTKNGHFALKVKLNIKAKKNVENVSLIDKIPAVVKIYEKFGTVKPSKIDSKNRRIQWDIGGLAAGEERAFSYVVYSKIGVVGKFSLPEALIVFEHEDELHEVESNRVFFMSEQTSKDE